MKTTKLAKVMSVGLAVSMLSSLAACTGANETSEMTTIPSQIATEPTETEENVPYTYGLGKTFHADQPVTYTMFFSDASWYPMVDTWKTEGIFKKIEEMTNVTLDIKSYDSGDYMDQITLDIQAGNAAYIIPKIYDDSKFVDGGAIVPISDYVQYMPYYTDFYNKYDLSKDIQTITRSNGKYYKLPGMKESNLINYSFVIRKDIWDKAGVDVVALQKDWTWADFLEALKKVKSYMVAQGMCKESDYIWSDLWCGSESGKGSGGNLLGIMASTYDCNAGWNIGNGMRYNKEQDKFIFSPTTDNYKQFLKTANSFVAAGILDPETFTQDDSTATAKYYNGKTAIMSVNQGQWASFEQNMIAQLGAGNFENYALTIPIGSTRNSTVDPARLENGVMISQKALDELGEDGFIKMLRFVDWLFYSPEAYTLYKWGVEGETFKVNADGSKELLPGYCCGGLGIGAKSEDDIDIRKKWGYAGGNFWYGHSVAEMTDNYIPAVKHFVDANIANRDVQNPPPPVAPTEDENEELTLIITPLIDEVNTWTLSFVTGQKDVEKDWDEFVKVCEEKRCQELVDRYNEIYKASK